MRHSLTQLLAASSGQGSPREPAAASSLPGEGGGGSSAETGDEAEPAADDAELLFPGLELDEWLEAAVAGAREGPRRGGRAGSSRLKAAEAARLNRQRKKQYVQGLESRLQGLAAENRQLRERNRGLGRRLRELEREAGYLRAVLANQSALGRLLSRLAGHGGGGAGGLRLSSSLWDDAREEPCEESSSSSSNGGDHDYALPVPREDGEDDEPRRPRRGTAPPSPAGLCLHVDRGQVSVEFCAVCARRAAAAASPPLAAAKM